MSDGGDDVKALESAMAEYTMYRYRQRLPIHSSRPAEFMQNTVGSITFAIPSYSTWRLGFFAWRQLARRFGNKDTYFDTLLSATDGFLRRTSCSSSFVA